MRLFLARHGNTFESGQNAVMVGKRSDLPLVATGVEQAVKLGKHFKNKGLEFDTIFSGKLKRQIEFAKIVSNELPNTPKVTISEALDEIDYGNWEGLNPINLINDTKYDAWIKKGIWPDVFAESENAKTEILLNWLNCLRSQYEEGQNILAISSNGIIRLFTKFSDLSCGQTIWSRLSESSAIEQLKLNTGSYSELEIKSFGLNIDLKNWNIRP